MRIGIAILGILGHLLISGLLAALAFLAALQTANSSDYNDTTKMLIALLKLWNLPVCLYDYFFTASPKAGYWFNLSFSALGPIHLVLFWGWVMVFGGVIAYWKRPKTQRRVRR